jgi:hypothetical protein
MASKLPSAWQQGKPALPASQTKPITSAPTPLVDRPPQPAKPLPSDQGTSTVFGVGATKPVKGGGPVPKGVTKAGPKKPSGAI